MVEMRGIKILKWLNVVVTSALAFMLMALLPPSSMGEGVAAQIVDSKELKTLFVQQIKENSQWSKKDVEISALRVLPRNIWVPAGKLTFRFDQDVCVGRLGRVSSVATILVDGRPVRKARVCGYVEVYKKVICAKNGLSRGQIVTMQDLETVRLPISKLRGKFFEDPKQVIGLAAKRTLRAGKVILATDVSRPVIVKRGNRVLIVAASENLRITVPGIVEQKGAEGDFVRVRNLDSKKVIIAQVKDENTVMVKF